MRRSHESYKRSAADAEIEAAKGRMLFSGVKTSYGELNELILKYSVDKYVFQLDITYEAATAETPERLRIVSNIPDNMYYAIGFGNSMTDTDMIAWHAKAEESYVEDYWSTGRSKPAVDKQHSLEWQVFP